MKRKKSSREIKKERPFYFFLELDVVKSSQLQMAESSAL